jgi:hypothetical protein
MVLKERGDFELSEDIITKWLPSAIFRAHAIKFDVVSRCYEANEKATGEAIFRAVHRDFMGETSYMSSLGHVPSRFLSSELCNKIIKRFVNNSVGHAEKRSECIRKVAEIDLEGAARAATILLKKNELPLSMMAACVQVQLVNDVKVGMESFIRVYSAHGKDFLRAIVYGFYDRGESFGVKIGDWPTKELAEMTKILFSAYRSKNDPNYKGAHLVSPDDRVIDLRRHCQNALMVRDDDESLLIIEKVAQTDETLKNQIGHKRATAGMLRLFEQRNEPAPAHPSLSKIVSLLENSNFRLVRDSNDLMNVVGEELRGIGQSVGHHLRTLYHTGCHAKGCSAQGVHLPEKALQEYIHARLSDRLPNGVLGPSTRIEMFKEAEQAKRRRTDLEVSVATFVPSMAKVVVEVKWSDNPELATGISEQLGKNYLVKEKRTHGIYVVGWCGKMTWQNCKTTNVPNQGRTPQILLQALEQEARLFMDSNPQISILPVVIDIAWKDSSGKSEKQSK